MTFRQRSPRTREGDRTGAGHASAAALRLVLVSWAIVTALPDAVLARPFRVGPVQALLDVTVAYGILARVEDQNPNIVGIGNGGNAPSVNLDDGDLNYDPGIVSNMIRGTAELTLSWRNFGAVVRGFGFYDFETELNDRERTPLTDDAHWLVGAGAELQDAYLSAQFDPFEVPVQLRAGRQVVNWGESSFLRFGVDVVNPIDVVAAFQPTSIARDLLIPQGMLWGAAQLTSAISVEAFYQYEWQPIRLAPVGWMFSADDILGGDGMHAGFEGFGQFSDLGTDLDEAFGLPDGTLGFDSDFMRIPKSGRDEPRNHGQFGFAVQGVIPEWNATKLGFHFVNYHSRFPLMSATTPDEAAVARTTDAAVQARAVELAAETGLPVSETRPISETVTVGEFTNDARLFATYPEDIQMLGFTFSTVTIATGTLISGELSHHFNWPIQVAKEEVIVASLSPIAFTEQFSQTSLGAFGPNQTVKGFQRGGKTQFSIGFTQLLGPRLGAAQSFVSVDVGVVHLEDMPPSEIFTEDSWGYRIAGGLTYDGLFGGLTVQPRLLWTQDVAGTQPPPGVAFVEGRKSIVAALGFRLTDRYTADLGYTHIFDEASLSLLRDRDFVRLQLAYYF